MEWRSHPFRHRRRRRVVHTAIKSDERVVRVWVYVRTVGLQERLQKIAVGIVTKKPGDPKRVVLLCSWRQWYPIQLLQTWDGGVGDGTSGKTEVANEG